MEADIAAKNENVYPKLNFLKNEMLNFFQCDEKDLDISNVHFANKHFFAAVFYRHINLEKSDLRKIITSTYYFDIEGEYIDREGIWYDSTFYTYNNLNPFFDVISQEIEDLNK